MFTQTTESGTPSQLPLQRTQLHEQQEAVQEADLPALNFQQHLLKSHVQQDQMNQAYPLPHDHPPILRSQDHEGNWSHEQSSNNNNNNLQNEEQSPNTLFPETNVSHDTNSATATDESLELEELEQFAHAFKQKRIQFGFTQMDAGLALGKFYSYEFSQTTVSRFEALNLSYTNMCKLKPLLQKWLEETENSLSNPSRISTPITSGPIMKQRKKRTSIEGTVRAALGTAFVRNPKPTTTEITNIAEELGMDRNVVRIWFCNRRQKERRMNLPLDLSSISSIENPYLPMPQPERFALHGENHRFTGGPLPLSADYGRSPPPPYTANHLVITSNTIK